MADLEISVAIDARGSKAGAAEVNTAIKGIRQSIAGVDWQAFSQKLKAAGEMMKQVGTTLSIAVTAPLVALGAAILKAGGEYEQALNIFQAVTKATGNEMGLAAERAKQLGADLSLPATSAKDAALAMTELGKAGLTAAQAMDAAKGVLQLAAAGQIDGARAAEIAANALNAFKLAAIDTTRVADLLAAAANASSAEIDDIALSMQQASANFSAAKMPIEDLVTAISAMANAGIKGSDAGTSLKTFIMSLQSPTDAAADTMKRLGITVFDTAGKMKDLPNIIGQFEQSLAGLTDEQKVQDLNKIFGSDAIRAAQILFATGTDGFAKLKEAVTASGAAAELANARMKGLSGAWQGFKSQLETIGIMLYEAVKAPLTEFLQTASEYAGRLGQAFSELSPFLQQVVIGFAAFAAAIGPILVIVGTLITAIGTIAGAISTISAAIAAVGGMVVVGPILAAVGVIIGEVALSAAALYLAWTTNFGGIQDLTKIVADAVLEAWDGMMIALRDLTSELLAEIQKFWAENKDQILAIVQSLSDTYKEIWTDIANFWRENSETIKTVAFTIWNAIKDVIVGLVKVIANTIKLVLAVINGDWAKAWEATKDILSAVVKAWASLVNAGIETVVGAVKLLFQAIWDLSGWISKQSVTLGIQLVEGIISGIGSMTGAFGSAAARIINLGLEKMRKAADIQSPSKVTHEMGQMIAQGLANGIGDGTSQVMQSVENMTQIVLDGLLDSSKSFGDRLRSIFSGIKQNFQQMVSDMARTWLGGLSTGPGGTPNFNPNSNGVDVLPTMSKDVLGSLMGNGPTLSGKSANGGIFSQIFGKGGIFGAKGFGANVGTFTGIGTISTILGGAIGGRAGGFLSNIGTGVAMGAQIGSIIPGIGTVIGAAVGGVVGFFASLFGGNKQEKRDKKEKMPELTKGFTDALAQLRALAADRNALMRDPGGVLNRAMEIRTQIAGGFGIQFESKKYQRESQSQISQRLVEADAIIAEIKKLSEISYAAGDRDRRLLPEFAGGVYMSPAFMNFRRRNGFLGGSFTGRDTIPAMLAHGEAVLNPRQMQTIRSQAGFDVFKTAGIPGYAGGGMAGSQTISNGPVVVQISMSQDAAGMWHATAKSDSGRKVLLEVVGDGFANDEINTRRR